MEGDRSARKVERYFWLLMFAGIAIRSLAITNPLVDAHLLRQCQTAATTVEFLKERGVSISTRIPWVPSSDARFVLELPLYNYLVIGVHSIVGNIDISGKITTILLWAASFWVLQGLWRRMLQPQQAFWANVLFVAAPFEIFHGQSFMPEMLVQFVAFAFLVLVFRHEERPTLARWSAAAAAGLLALLLKLPATAHLYVVLAVLVVRREGWRAVLRPRYLIAALLTVITMKLWSSYADSVNAHPLSFGSSKGNFRVFVGTLSDRFQPKLWAMIFLYVGAFVVPGPAFLAAVWGGFQTFRAKVSLLNFKLWLLSIGVFYLAWFGNGPPKQGYYNISAVAPLAALGAIGLVAILQRLRSARARTLVAVGFTALQLSAATISCIYLFRPDRQILAAATWIHDHSGPDELWVFRAQHRWDMVDYGYNAVPVHYSGRPAFIWVRTTPEDVKEEHLKAARRILITLPPRDSHSAIAEMARRFRGIGSPAAENWDWLQEKGFRKAVETPEFVVYEKS